MSSSWPVVLEIPVAWGEMDAFAHVNNTVFVRWFESVRIACFERAGMLERMMTEKIGPILARTEIDHRRPVTYPDTVTTETCIVSIGNSSFVMGYRITSHAQKAVVAEGKTVVVLFNYTTGEKVPIDEALRARLQTLVA